MADRWHLWNNLGKHVEKTVAAHRRCLHRDAAPPDSERPEEHSPELLAAEAAEVHAKAKRLTTRTRQRYEQVQQLKAEGMGVKPIMRELELARAPSAASTTPLTSRSSLPSPVAGGRPSWRSSSLT